MQRGPAWSVVGMTLACAAACGGRSQHTFGGDGGSDGDRGAAGRSGIAGGAGRPLGGTGGSATSGGRAGRRAGAGAGGVAIETGGNGDGASSAGDGAGNRSSGEGGGPPRGPVGPGPGGTEDGGAGASGGEAGAGDEPCVNDWAPTLRVPEDQSTIQAAIDAAGGRAVIAVSPGVYFENLDFKGKGIVLLSTSGPKKTVNDGSSKAAVITMESNEPDAVVEGFTIRNGQDYWGAGITLNGTSPTIRNNWFLDNDEAVGGFGAAIGGNGASPLVDSNYFSGNWCDDQWLSGVVSFVNFSSPRIFNNIIARNDCRGINITTPASVAPDVANNTLVDNRVGIYILAQTPTAGQLYRNNVIVGGDSGLKIDFFVDDPGPVWIHNLVFGSTSPYDGIADPTGTLGNVATDPMLVAPDLLDFHLRAGSPAIDNGTSEGPDLPAFDYDGRVRIDDGDSDGSSAVDLGAYEFGAPLRCPRKR